jgi:hypothetical protein
MKERNPNQKSKSHLIIVDAVKYAVLSCALHILLCNHIHFHHVLGWKKKSSSRFISSFSLSFPLCSRATGSTFAHRNRAPTCSTTKTAPYVPHRFKCNQIAQASPSVIQLDADRKTPTVKLSSAIKTAKRASKTNCKHKVDHTF